MRHLIIRNFGPLQEVDIELGGVNLIIGLQGSGKSCVMMTACYCAWVQKRISLRQSAKEFENGTDFIDIMTSYYHAKGYIHEDTFIGYATKYMEFSYSHSDKKFIHKWKGQRWNYRRPKVSYVPAERNMVSLVSNWNRLETKYDSILDFKEDWDTARRYVKKEKNVLGMGVSYEYDESSDTNAIITADGKMIELTNSSSGIQSLIPQFVHIDYVTKGIYDAEKNDKDKSFSEKQIVTNLLDILYKRIYKEEEHDNIGKKDIVHFEGKDYIFHSKDAAQQFHREAKNFLYTDHAEVFLEEPESNLFPPTQFQLMNWIVELSQEKEHKNFFFIATHSPYILNHLLQENIKDFKLFLTYSQKEGLFNVKTASEEDTQDIYDNGSDAFFNFDAFTHQ